MCENDLFLANVPNKVKCSHRPCVHLPLLHIFATRCTKLPVSFSLWAGGKKVDMSMYENKYLIDGEPANARDIIKTAEVYDSDFASDWCKQPSVAAGILRRNGHTVEDRPQENKVETDNFVQQTNGASA